MILLRFSRNDPVFNFLRAVEKDGLGKNYRKKIFIKSSPATGGVGGFL